MEGSSISGSDIFSRVCDSPDFRKEVTELSPHQLTALHDHVSGAGLGSVKFLVLGVVQSEASNRFFNSYRTINNGNTVS